MEALYEKKILNKKYHQLIAKGAPEDLITYPFSLGEKWVYVHHFVPFCSLTEHQELLVQISKAHPPDLIKVKRLTACFEMETEDFLKAKHLWQDQSGGISVVFYRHSLKFLPFYLPSPARYKALDHFGWNLEVTSPRRPDEFFCCTSPQEEVILNIEEKAKSLGFTEGKF